MVNAVSPVAKLMGFPAFVWMQEDNKVVIQPMAITAVPSSTVVEISQEARQLLADEQAGRRWDWEI
jgi:multisubunit Na+/H+ antiporter MnhE subunit